MKKITILLFMIMTAFATNAQTLICGTADCGGGTTILSSAPTDGTTFYIVWFVTSSNTPIAATATPQPSATSGTANIGSSTITSLGGTSYRISIAATISANQNKPTISNVDVNLAYYTIASFPSTAGTGSLAIPTATPLPVDFMDIEVTGLNGFNFIKWSTASELNNDRFVIERSFDGIDWVEIGTVEGAGTSNEVLNYDFSDVATSSALNSFYRIKQFDYSGFSSISDIVRVVGQKGTVGVFPNPALANEVTVSSSLDIQLVEVRNITGQIVDAEFNFESNRLDISALESGIYFVTINSDVVRLVK